MLSHPLGTTDGRLVYALVACGRTILTEYTVTSGNFPTVTRVLLEKIPTSESKMSYVYDQYVYHYVVEEGVTYLCLADEALKRKLAFSFLEDIKDRFKGLFSLEMIYAAPSFSLNEDFFRILRNRMQYYNEPFAVGQAKAKGATGTPRGVDDLYGSGVENIEKLLHRGEKIELLVEKSELYDSTYSFERSTAQLYRSLWWNNMKTYCALLALFLTLAGIAVSLSCRATNLRQCLFH